MGSLYGSLQESEGDFYKVNDIDNGQLAEKGTFKDGKKHGPWVVYKPYGTVMKNTQESTRTV